MIWKFALLLLVGLAMAALGVWNLRARLWEEGVPAAELLAARAMGEEPAPRTAWRRRLARIHGWVMTLFGLVVAGFAAAFLLTGDTR